MRVLGCEVATRIEKRDITFLWLHGRGSVMIGLWGPACPNPPMSRGIAHFAMRLPAQDIEAIPQKLRALGVTPLGFNGEAIDEPIVLAWMPAVSVYFKDPDGNSLEFIGMLDEPPAPEKGVVSLSEWRQQ